MDGAVGNFFLFKKSDKQQKGKTQMSRKGRKGPDVYHAYSQ